MSIPSSSCLIYKPRKNISSSIILVSNSPCINFANSSHNDYFVAPKIMSSTYICTTNKLSSSFFKNNVVSTFPLLKLFSIRNLLSISYQALGAYFRR